MYKRFTSLQGCLLIIIQYYNKLKCYEVLGVYTKKLIIYLEEFSHNEDIRIILIITIITTTLLDNKFYKETILY